MAALPSRPELRRDGTTGPGVIEAATVATVAAVAGIGLVEDQWPWHLDVAVRQSWLDQQRELAAQIADRLGDLPWRLLTLAADGMPQVFHYRESEYGWVLATATRTASSPPTAAACLLTRSHSPAPTSTSTTTEPIP